MTLDRIIRLAESFGMHGDGDFGAGWWIVAVAMMALFMGAMMWMMMRGMGHGSPSDSTAPWDRFVARESPIETLEHRFAKGEISIEEYRARREVLVNGAAETSADHDDEEALTAPPVGGGR